MTKQTIRKDHFQHSYMADPDYLLWVLSPDPVTAEPIPHEVGYAVKYKKGGGIKITVNDEEFAKQLLYETNTFYVKPFKRNELEGKSPKRKPAPNRTRTAKPRYRPGE